MANQVLAFAELLAGAIILEAGIKGDSITNVVQGISTQHDLAGASSTGGGASTPTGPAAGTTAGVGATLSQSAKQLLAKIPAGTFASGVTTNGIQPRVLAAVLWAKTHGWTGHVISGFRTLADQTRIYNSGVRPAAAPGTSNHEKGLAVDVTDPAGFAQALANAPTNIQLRSGASYGDPGHFSPTGG